jgi:hypothetical protein
MRKNVNDKLFTNLWIFEIQFLSLSLIYNMHFFQEYRNMIILQMLADSMKVMKYISVLYAHTCAQVCCTNTWTRFMALVANMCTRKQNNDHEICNRVTEQV